ncbi:hypothetical protein SAMN05216338_100999 [Bradyrhizobium sp. Rc2d]|nr:hypothetical protein SAMN05216338_100999 [Bradyrhizobium sp. Rc2d]
MARKAIDLGPNLEFDSISSAKSYFGAMLKDAPLDADVPAGQFQALKHLYEEYCKRTNWPVPAAPAAFYATHERAKGYTTKCFGVRFQDGSVTRFSLDKALSAVATSA